MGDSFTVEQRQALLKALSTSILRDMFPQMPQTLPDLEVCEENYSGLRDGDAVLSGDRVVIRKDGALFSKSCIEICEDFDAAFDLLSEYATDTPEQLLSTLCSSCAEIRGLKGVDARSTPGTSHTTGVEEFMADASGLLSAAVAEAVVSQQTEDGAPARGSTAESDSEWSTTKKVVVGVVAVAAIGVIAYGVSRALRK